MDQRMEKDSLEQIAVPASALYGAQTRRAELNFPISGWRLPAPFLRALARLKRAAALANSDLGKLDRQIAEWITAAADEVLSGKLDEHFPLDVFQTGSATSTNMNMNEVIANRAIQLAGGVVGSKKPVHPNDHVNMGQSSNDLTPTAAHIAAAVEINAALLPALEELRFELFSKTPLFMPAVKIGRTHLQDATPIRMGQVFLGYCGLVEDAISRIEEARDRLLPVALGGTAVGTGVNCYPGFPKMVLDTVSRETGLAFCESGNHFQAQSAMSGYVGLMSALKCAALSLCKIANDIRFLASGPRAGYGELRLPSLQPGSSIMPGKVNPVLCESLMQAGAFAVGAEAGVSFAAATLSNFELATAWPYSVWQALETIRIMANAVNRFAQGAVAGLDVDAEKCAVDCERSLSLVTGLAPVIGYDAAAALAKEAAATGRTVRETAGGRVEKAVLDRALDPGRQADGTS